LWVLWHIRRPPSAPYSGTITTTRIRVLMCDDHELVRRGLHALLDADLTLDVVGEATSADEAVEMAATLTPDVVVMDVRMPGRSGNRGVPRHPRGPEGDPLAASWLV
jgi:CheY-like chemotaxis protein